jgi:propanol-preferring alcohol dehydrogenase
MVLEQIGHPLLLKELPDPEPGPNEIRVRISACGVCRTDLHVVDGELPNIVLPIIPGHEVVGVVDKLGPSVDGFALGERVGVPWLGHTCGVCPFCTENRENLCDQPAFTGYTRNGGYATHAIADARYVFPLGSLGDDISAAPLLCAGLIGWRALVKAGPGRNIGLYGFGAAGHIILQVAKIQGRSVYAFTRWGDGAAQRLALDLGADWAGDSEHMPPTQLDAAILFAPVGALVPTALRALRKGGRVVCAGIHMSDIPSFPYDILWQEREILSVANLTRQDAKDFLAFASRETLRTEITTYPLTRANDALNDLRAGRFQGAAVLTI